MRGETTVDHDVFISYSSKDKAVAEAAFTALERHGVRCWIDSRSIPPGAAYAGSIIRAIPASRLLLLVFSNHSNSSTHVLTEVERAVHYGVQVLPWRIDNAKPSDDLEFFLSIRQWLDASTASPAAHLERLVEEVQRFLPTKPPITPKSPEERLISQWPEPAQRIFHNLKKRAIAFAPDVTSGATQAYVKLAAGKVFVEFHSRKEGLVLHLRPEGFDLAEDTTGLFHGIEVTRLPDKHGWTLNHRLKVGTDTNLEAVEKLLFQSYQAIALPPMADVQEGGDIGRDEHSREGEVLASYPAAFQRIYQDLKQRALLFGPDVRSSATKSYLKFETDKVFAIFSFSQRSNTLMGQFCSVELDMPENSTALVHGIKIQRRPDTYGPQKYFFKVDQQTDLNAVEKLLRHSYHAVTATPYE